MRQRLRIGNKFSESMRPDKLIVAEQLGLSSQIAGLPGGIISGGNSDAAFSLDNASNGVVNPSSMTPDIAALGITDLNQLVNDYRVASRGCQSTEADDLLDWGIERVTQFNQDLFLVGSDIDTALQRINDYVSESTPTDPADQAIKEALESLRQDPNASLLLIPACYDDEEVGALVTSHLGKLVHSSEIAAIIASLGEVDEYGCRPANVVDLTDLHAEILSRFQVVVATDDRVVAAENAMLLAQAALEAFESIHGKDVCAPTAIGESRDLCNQYFLLFSAAEDRAEEYAETLEDVYDVYLNDGYMPAHNVALAADEAREKILLGIVGVFIPLTPEDMAIDAATLGLGKVFRFLRGGIDVLRARRVDLDGFIADGSAAAARANAVKMEKYYAGFPAMKDLNYADVVRIEGKLGTDGLRKLETDFVSTPGLSAAFKNDPALADAWKAIDDIGACSFDGSTTVLTELGLKPIEALVAGSDRVLARDQRTGAQEFKNILAKYSNQYAEKVVIRSTNNVTHEEVSVVSNKIHPIFVKSSGGLLRVASEGHAYLGDQEHGEWVDASELRVGDSLKNDDGTWSIINSVQIIAEEFTAYNLTVEDFNTYFVSEQGKSRAFWVHNTCISVIQKDPVALDQMNKLAANNNLGLNQNDIAELIAKPSTKGQQWDDPKEVLVALERSSKANIPGLEISHMKFPAPTNGEPNFVLDNAKKYQAEASGDAGLSFNMTAPDGKKVSFDDIDDSGALIDRKWGHGGKVFETIIAPDGTSSVVAYNMSRQESILDQARRQIAAAGDTPIKWEISTELGAKGIEQLFKENGIDIVVQWVKQKVIVVP